MYQRKILNTYFQKNFCEGGRVRLRRWVANPVAMSRVGSNPTPRAIFDNFAGMERNNTSSIVMVSGRLFF